MASDGPPKRPGSTSGAPRVPPPPKLSFMEEAAALEAAADQGEAGSPLAEAPVELSVELNIDPAPEPEVPEVPQARRGVLPPPPSDSKRAQPLAAMRQRSSGAPNRPSASGLPSGMRAPGVPEETEAENTDILIASAVAALTEGDPANNSSASLSAVPLSDAEPSIASFSLPPPSPAPEPEERKRRGFLWFGVAALAAVTLVAILWPGRDDDAREETSAPSVVAAADDLQPGEPVAAVLSAPVSPDLPPLAVDVPPDLGGAWVELEDAIDVGGELAMALDVGSAELPADALADAAEADGSEGDAGEAKPKSARRGKRPRKSKPPATSNNRPPPAAPAKQPADAAALLADARKALAAGQARKAYTLASKSRSAKRTSAALVVMAKAACRFGGESQAKSAFNQLSVTNRRGLRAECRNHGVRLGL